MVAWNSGIYIRLAIASTLDKNSRYPTRPMLDSRKQEILDTPEIKQKRIKDKFVAMIPIINARIRGGG